MKKAMFFTMVAFLVVSGCSKPAGELGVNPNENQLKSASTDRSISHYFTGSQDFDLVCDGTVVDHIKGVLDIHCVMRIENGDMAHPVWMIMYYTGSLTSSKGELFEIKRTVTSNLPQSGDKSFRFSVKGDQGTHIINMGTMDMVTGKVTIEKAICPGISDPE